MSLVKLSVALAVSFTAVGTGIFVSKPYWNKGEKEIASDGFVPTSQEYRPEIQEQQQEDNGDSYRNSEEQQGDRSLEG